MNADGTVANSGPSPHIYKTSGSSNIDDYALECIEKAAPYTLSEWDKKILTGPEYLCLAKLNSAANEPFITRKIGVNYQYFASQLRGSFFSRWIQLPRKKSFHTECAFLVQQDGTIQNQEIAKSCGDTKIDLVCLNTFSQLKAVHPPPPASPDNLPVKIVFDYDKAKNASENEIWVDGKKIDTDGSSDIWDRYINSTANAFFETAADSVATSAWMANFSRSIKLHWPINFEEEYRDYFKIKTAFKVRPDGVITTPKIIQSFNSNPRRDSDALRAILATSPLTPPPMLTTASKDVDIEFTFENGKPKSDYRLGGFRPRMPGVSIVSKQEEKQNAADLLMAPYLVQVTSKIKSKWQRDQFWKEDETVVIDLNKDGTVKNFHLKFVTGKNEQDRTIIEAVKAAQPFPQLPKEAGESYSATIKFSPQSDL